MGVGRAHLWAGRDQPGPRKAQSAGPSSAASRLTGPLPPSSASALPRSDTEPAGGRPEFPFYVLPECDGGVQEVNIFFLGTSTALHGNIPASKSFSPLGK